VRLRETVVRLKNEEVPTFKVGVGYTVWGVGCGVWGVGLRCALLGEVRVEG
jgi:hypothetical protein